LVGGIAFGSQNVWLRKPSVSRTSRHQGWPLTRAAYRPGFSGLKSAVQQVAEHDADDRDRVDAGEPLGGEDDRIVLTPPGDVCDDEAGQHEEQHHGLLPDVGEPRAETQGR
jgi:hypothetical protein